MAKIMHGKSLSDLDTNKEYLVWYSGTYADRSSRPVERDCEGFGKIKRSQLDGEWYATLYAHGSDADTEISVKVTYIDSSFIIEL